MKGCGRGWWSWRGRSRDSAIGGCMCCCDARGEAVNHKRVHRVYREAGLSLRRKKRKHCVRVGTAAASLHGGESGVGAGLCARRGGERAGDPGVERGGRVHAGVSGVGSGHQLCEPESDAGAGDDHRASAGVPQAIRCDNGPELTSRHFLAWCIERKIELVHIQPGRPMQNGQRGEFSRAAARGMLARELVRESVRGAEEDRGVAKRVQPGAAAQQSGVSDAGGVCAGKRRRGRLWKRRCGKVGTATFPFRLEIARRRGIPTFPQPRRRRSLHPRCRQQPGCRIMKCAEFGGRPERQVSGPTFTQSVYPQGKRETETNLDSCPGG